MQGNLGRAPKAQLRRDAGCAVRFQDLTGLAETWACFEILLLVDVWVEFQISAIWV